MGDVLEGFSVGVDELAQAAGARRTPTRDGRICLCGHPVSKHSVWEGRSTCAPTRMLCPCVLLMPVIDVGDTRPFLRKTQGEGVNHALMQGLYGLIEKGREWRWVEGFPVCMRCEVRGVAVLPFAISDHRKPSTEPEKINVLLCPECAVVVTKDGML